MHPMFSRLPGSLAGVDEGADYIAVGFSCRGRFDDTVKGN